MVEHHLAKVDVVGSSPIARSIFFGKLIPFLLMEASDLYDFPESLPFKRYFDVDANPWEWVSQIKVALEEFDFGAVEKREDIPHHLVVEGDVYIHPNVKLPPYGYIKGPAYIGAHTELRAGVNIRGNVIVGEKCVLGNSCEFKNCVLMDSVQVPHFNYVGDTVLGTGSHLGAGVITANVRLDRQPVSVTLPEERVKTGLKKLGALVGEMAEVGCNTVLQPGTILGKQSIIGSNLPCGGYVPSGAKVFAEKPKVG